MTKNKTHSKTRYGALETPTQIRTEIRKNYIHFKRGEITDTEARTATVILQAMQAVTKDSDLEAKISRLEEKFKEVMKDVHKATRS